MRSKHRTQIDGVDATRWDDNIFLYCLPPTHHTRRSIRPACAGYFQGHSGASGPRIGRCGRVWGQLCIYCIVPSTVCKNELHDALEDAGVFTIRAIAIVMRALVGKADEKGQRVDRLEHLERGATMAMTEMRKLYLAAVEQLCNREPARLTWVQRCRGTLAKHATNHAIAAGASDRLSHVYQTAWTCLTRLRITGSASGLARDFPMPASVRRTAQSLLSPLRSEGHDHRLIAHPLGSLPFCSNHTRLLRSPSCMLTFGVYPRRVCALEMS